MSVWAGHDGENAVGRKRSFGTGARQGLSLRAAGSCPSVVLSFLRRCNCFSGHVCAATAHQLTRILYHLMRYDEAYVKQIKATYVEPTRQRQEKQLQRHAKEFGYTLTKVETAAGATEPPLQQREGSGRSRSLPRRTLRTPVNAKALSRQRSWCAPR